MKLTQIPRGGQALIKALPQGQNAAFRLSELGLRVGQRVDVVSVQPLRGPVIVRVGQTDIALGHRVAERIDVEPAAPGNGEKP